MAEQDGGKLVYEVDIDVAPLLSGSNKAKAELGALGDAAQEVAPGFEKLSKGAKGVSSALVMPEVNKLSAKLAQLSGKIGVSTDAATDAVISQNKFSGALSTVASTLGAGYVSNVGAATNALIKHAKEAVAATNAQLENAVAAQKEATALQASASQLVANAAGEKKLAEAATQTAAAELQVAEAVFARKEADIASLESLLLRQKESLRQSEANLQITNSEKAVSQALRDRNAVEITQNKILKQSNQAVKEVTAAEDRVKAAKTASATASEKLTQSMALEAAAVATVAKANDAATMATERLTVASKVQAAAVSGARSALSLLGGPSGILLLAAAGVYSLYQAMNDTSGIDKYKQEIDDAARRIEYLTKVQADAASAKTKIRLDIDKQSLKDAENDVEAIKNSINTIKSISGSPKLIAELEKDLTLAKEKSSEFAESIRVANERIGQFTQQAQKAGDASTAIAIANETYDKSMKSVIESNEVLEQAIHGSLAAAEEMAARKNLEKALEDIGITGEEATLQVEKLQAAFAKKRELTFEQSLKSIQDNVKALKIEMTEGAEAAAAYRAELSLKNAGITDPEKVKEYTDAIREQAKAQKQASESRKSSGKSKTSRADGRLEKQQSQAASLRREYELLTSGTTDVARSMAIFNAVQSLGAKATAKQKEEAAAEAATVFDLKQKVDDFRKAAEITPELKLSKAFADEAKELQRLFSEGLIDENAFKELGAKAKAKFDEGMAEARANAIVSSKQEAAAKVDPVQALANEHARKLELIKQFEANETLTHDQALAIRNASDTEYERQRIEAQWEIFRNQNTANELLASSLDGVQSSASSAITGLLNGTQSLQEAFANIGSTILNSVVSSLVQMGLEWVKSQVMGQAAATAGLAATLAQATAAASAWAPAAVSASIATMGTASSVGSTAYATSLAAAKGLALAGARYNGGPVSADSMYRVGEKGKPEIYQASNGNQFMIPGDNGRVISNKDMQGGSGGTSLSQIMNLTINTTGGIDEQAIQKLRQVWKSDMIIMIKDQQRSKGLLSRTK